MKSFLDICEFTKKELGRRLDDEEKLFLKWMYKKHQNEEGFGKSLNVYPRIKREKSPQYETARNT